MKIKFWYYRKKLDLMIYLVEFFDKKTLKARDQLSNLYLQELKSDMRQVTFFVWEAKDMETAAKSLTEKRYLHS